MLYIKVRWNLYGDLEFAPHYNIAPSQSVPLIVKGERGQEAKLMKWGLLPSWAPDPSVGNRMINARAETLLKKLRSSVWSQSDGASFPPMGFMMAQGRKSESHGADSPKNKEPFAFAELWDEWRDFDTGDVLNSFTIITTDRNALVRRIHNRMPVIYDRAMG